jgi:prepilin-type N-terminal cleavage/methylation domain-containing protein
MNSNAGCGMGNGEWGKPRAFRIPHSAFRIGQGFTLIELLIAMAIGVAIMGVVMVTLMISRSSYLSADASIRVQEEVRRAYDKMVKELREAGNAVQNGASRLDFQTANSYDTANCAGICWGNDFGNGNTRWVHYLTNGSTLYRCQSAAQASVIADYSTRCAGGGAQPCCDVLALDVQSFSVTYSGANRTVTMQLETKITSSQLPGGSMGVTPTPLRTSVQLRNAS